MDIRFTNVPHGVNRVEFRIFLQDKLRTFDILAFEVVKKVGQDCAYVTVAYEEKGLKFLRRYGERGFEKLICKSRPLRCLPNNRRSQPEPLKVSALREKETQIKSKKLSRSLDTRRTGPPLSTFPVQTVMTGVWSYDQHDRLIFNQKYKDARTGCVTFGRHALMVYLEFSDSTNHYSKWHCRIDVPYVILEHTIVSYENGTSPVITLTLKYPPKIYEIVGGQDLHLYTGKSAEVDTDVLSAFRTLSLATLKPPGRTAKLERLCTLHPGYKKNVGLCMVYRLCLPNKELVHQLSTVLKSFSVPEVHHYKTLVSQELTSTIEIDIGKLEKQLSRSNLEFAVQFQVLALVFEGTVTPAKMTELLPRVMLTANQYGERSTASAVRFLGRQLPTPAPHVESSLFDLSSMDRHLKQGAEIARESEYCDPRNEHKKQDNVVLIFKATITPTGTILRGPDQDTTNRILRKYSQHSDYFMRVSFTDEDGLSVFHDQKASQQHVYSRFRKVLQEGILIAGRLYEFLGFSHSSLRCHQAWFMAPFVQDGVTVNAKDVIRDLGDFTHIRCSAKCAARIGQAFSDTMFAIQIPGTAQVMEDKADVKRNGHIFSDGCGTMSQDLFEIVWQNLNPRQRLARPTVLQVRYRGAKGVLSLDSSLTGQKLHARTSMTKYVAGAGWRDIELCGAAYRPLRVYLNHQFIKILEDLGVPLQKFTAVQDEALSILEKVIKHPLNVASFLRYSNSATQARIPRLIELMHHTGLSFQADRFLCEIVEIAAMSTLRDLKYRARIPVDNGFLLYGIMDETNTLREGQVYIATKDETDSGRGERHTLVRDQVIVTKAPALHPGDIQVVSAVDVPKDSPLRDLHNCVVFSQQGARDLPSQLSGGDLDGDLFHIIFDERLIPKFTCTPADYTPVTPRDLGRAVEVKDIVDFFIDFMINDKLGMISTKHKIRADCKEQGTFDSECIMLAKLASDAVDFSKSGVPADLKDLPRGTDHLRPDFMAPSHDFVLTDLGTAELQTRSMEDIDDPDSLSVLDPDSTKIRYYRSEKVLGHLYRNIDERRFFDRMKGDFAAVQNTSSGESLVQKIERYVDRETRNVQWEHHTSFAENLREYYELNMLEIMDTLRIHRGKPLTELEVFSGNILGHKQRASNQYVRAANMEVQARFNRDVDNIVHDIIKGEGDHDGDDHYEALPRAIACFKVALRTDEFQHRVLIKSWKYVAMSVCLEELWKFQGGKLRKF